MIRVQHPARPRRSGPARFLAARTARRRLSWWEGRPVNLALDVAVVAGLAWFAATVHAGAGERAAFYTALPVLLVRRRFPWLPVLAVPVLCFDPAAILAVAVACYTAARQWGARWRTLAAFALASGSVTYAAWDPRPGDGILYQLVVPSAWLAACMLAGLWIHQRRTLLGALQDRAAQAERNSELLAERAVAAERRRIAREMHDVVAHRVSTIALQAGALTLTAPDERTAGTAEVIRAASATALTELREILDVLRRDQRDEPGHTELPDDVHVVQLDGSVRADVETLVRDSTAAGASISLHAPGELPDVPGPVRRAVYRVVQEALTNAAKHAPNAHVDIDLNAGPGQLRIAVANGRAGRNGEHRPVPGSGYGLLGMRERVALAQGTLHAGPAEDGGFRVDAAFPLPPSQRKELM